MGLALLASLGVFSERPHSGLCAPVRQSRPLVWKSRAMLAQERQVLEQLAQPFQQVKAWRSRVAVAEKPERGSELDGDAAIWPHHPTWELSRMALASGVDHLNLARVAIDARELFPSAHFTALRGALVGGSMGVWALHPDARHDRQQRALRILDEWYQRRLEYQGEVRAERLSDAERIAVADQADFLSDRRAMARELWQEADGCSLDRRPHQTAIVREAAALTFANPAMVENVMLHWRLMSGDAHALGWPLTIRARSWQREGRSGMGMGVVDIPLSDVADAFLSAFRLVKAGWSLFDRRSEE